MEDEITRIWGNTKRFKTARNEVSTLFDLFDGFKKSGYEFDPFQAKEHQELAEFVIFDREKVGSVFSHLVTLKQLSLEEKWFGMRFGSHGEYKNGALGLPPKDVLTSEDLQSNPNLLALLIGQFESYLYYNGKVVADEESKEVIIKVRNSGNITPQKLRSYTPKEANDLALELGNRIAEKANVPGRLELKFSAPNLYVGNNALYEATNIPFALMRIRALEKEMERRGWNPVAAEGIANGINKQKRNINLKIGDYYPAFKS